MIDVQTSLCILIKMMHAHYDRKVILLLDEYDVPVAKASDKGYYAEMMEVMKTVMSTSLKDNPSLEFAVVTGCLKIAKESSRSIRSMSGRRSIWTTCWTSFKGCTTGAVWYNQHNRAPASGAPFRPIQVRRRSLWNSLSLLHSGIPAKILVQAR